MLERRKCLHLAAGCVSLLAMRAAALGQSPPSANNRVDVPKGACDTHVHVIGDPKQFPMSLERDYTPPPGTGDMLVKALDELGFDRVVIVTPTIYGLDNSATIDAIQRVGRTRARGVVLLASDVSHDALAELAARGACGVRFLLGGGPHFDIRIASRKLRTWFDVIGGGGWHLDMSMPPDVTAALVNEFKSSPIPL